MAKKIKFALQMADGEKVRTIEDLREHFDLESVMTYFSDGKLLEWLGDRYYDTEADTIRSLSGEEGDFKQRLCAALQVAYTGDDISMEDIEAVQEKKAKLKQLTSDEEIINHAADTAKACCPAAAQSTDSCRVKLWCIGINYTPSTQIKEGHSRAPCQQGFW